MADVPFESAFGSDAPCAVRRTDAERPWSPRRKLALIVGSSLFLWTLILAPFFIV